MRRSSDSLSGKKERPAKKVNPLTVAQQIEQIMEIERRGPYKLVYDLLAFLDEEYPNVAKNHSQFDIGNEPMEYTLASFVFSSHAANMYPDTPKFTRKNALDAVKMLEAVPLGRTLLMELICQLFPQAVICTEHLFYLQRHIERLLELPNEDRPKPLRGQKASEWLFPHEKINDARLLAVELWKEKEDRVNEARQQGE